MDVNSFIAMSPYYLLANVNKQFQNNFKRKLSYSEHIFKNIFQLKGFIFLLWNSTKWLPNCCPAVKPYYLLQNLKITKGYLLVEDINPQQNWFRQDFISKHFSEHFIFMFLGKDPSQCSTCLRH